MKLNRAILTGTFRTKEATATFTRSPTVGWTLCVVIDKKTATYTLGPSCKPCWTVAKEFFERLAPAKLRAKPTFKRKREIEAQTAGYFRVISGDTEQKARQ